MAATHTPGYSSVKAMSVALRDGVSTATLPDNRAMTSGVNYAISLEDYARITNAARNTVIASTPITSNYVVPLSNGTDYALDLTTIHNKQRDTTAGHDPRKNLWDDAQCVANWKEGTVVQGFNGTAFQLVRAATGTSAIAAGSVVVWGGVDSVYNDVDVDGNGSLDHLSTSGGKQHYVVTADISDITEQTGEVPTFAGVAIAAMTADYYGWIQIAGTTVETLRQTTLDAGDVAYVSETDSLATDGLIVTFSSFDDTDTVRVNYDGSYFVLERDTNATYGHVTATNVAFNVVDAPNKVLTKAAVEAALLALGADVTVEASTLSATNMKITFNDIADNNGDNITITNGTGGASGTVASAYGSAIGTVLAIGDDGVVTDSWADIELRSPATFNRHYKRAKLFYDK